MKYLYTFTSFALAAILGLSSCSSSKNTQSSADMYSSGNSKGSGDYVTAEPNDQYVQMKVQDPDRWSYFDDYSAYDAYSSPYYGTGFGSPYYSMGYSSFFGPSYGLGFGFGFGNPYSYWNNYFVWNSWYNPYFYNPVYGAPALYVGKSPTSVYSSLRPFGTTSYANGLAHVGVTGASRNAVYRSGMTSTTAYNSHVVNSRSTNTNSFRPVSNNNGFRNVTAPTRSYSPSFGGNGGFRSGGFSGGRH